MSTNVCLPALGESVTEGTISRWLKAVGDRVEIDEALVEVSTDKVDTEIPSPVAGIIVEIKFGEDDTVPVGGVLAVIGDEGEVPASSESAAVPEQSAEAPQPAETSAAAEEAAAAVAPAQPENTAPIAAPAQGGGASVEVTLPALGESVTEGTISRWLKNVGDTVETDEPLVEVSTDKVDTEIPSPAAGVLLEIRVKDDEVCAVGSVLGVVGDAPAESAPAAPAAADPAAEAPTAPAPAAPREAAVARRASDDQGEDPTYVTPLVRKMAEEHGVDLRTLVGTGVGGRIRKQDVLAAAEGKPAPAPAAPATPAPTAPKPAVPAQAPAAAKPATPAAQAPAPAMAAAGDAKRGLTEKMSRLRATIAKRMVESLQVSAQLTATVEVDLSEIGRIRGLVKEDFKKREGVGLSYLPFITKVAVETLKQFPAVNATIDTDAGTITYNDVEHIGIAVDTDKGLLVPVIKNAGDLNIAGLAKKIVDLADRTRTNRVVPDELTGGTFTITNYGSAGALFDTPIINQPQVAILGTGAIVKRPVVMSDPRFGETIVPRDMMYLSLTYDHRLVDGADAARFLSAMKKRLEEGDFGAEFGV